MGRRYPAGRSLAVVALAVLAALVAGLPASSSTGLAREGLVAYTTTLHPSEIYLANASGGAQRRLTNDAETQQRWPALSPDGSKVAFATKRSGGWRIYVMDSDGTDARELMIYDEVPLNGFKGYPDWSPDGTQVVFVAEYDTVTDVVVHSLATGETRNVTRSRSYELRPRWSPDGLRILFSRAGGGGEGWDLYTIGVDGTALTRLTTQSGWELDGAFSPDGSHIAFVAYPDGIPDLFVMNADGSNVRDLSNTPDIPEIQPAWSPSGIAFRAVRDGVDGIYLMQPDGRGLRRLSGATEWATDPDWSADGSALVWVSGRHARGVLGTSTAYSSGFKHISTGSANDSDPAWSFDGRRLAFVRSSGRANSDILTMTARGRSVRNLTKGRGLNWAPDWSPDGRRIAFVRFESFGAQVWLMNADGSKARALTKAGAWNEDPSWSPDGRRIVYSARRNGNYDLYVLDVRSGRERRLTRTWQAESSPAWSPDGALIAFVDLGSGDASDIAVVAADGSGRRLLTGGDTDTKGSPAWSPAGNRIIYEREYFFGRDTDLWIVDVRTGSNERAVGDDWNEYDPSWQPLR